MPKGTKQALTVYIGGVNTKNLCSTSLHSDQPVEPDQKGILFIMLSP